MKLTKKIIIFCSFFLLNGCIYINGEKGFIKNRDTDYLSAQSVPPLLMPPGVASASIHAAYPVPDHYYPEETKRVTLVPPGL